MPLTVSIIILSIIILVVPPILVDILIYYKTYRGEKYGIIKYKVTILKHYIKINSIILYYILALGYIGITALTVFIGYQKGWLLSSTGVIVLMLMLIVGGLMTQVLKIANTALLLHIQYSKYENSRIIEYDTINKILTLKDKNNNAIKKIEIAEISSIEVHKSSANFQNPISNYEYVRLTLVTQQQFIVTSLIANITMFTSIFNIKKVQESSNKYNWLDK